MVVWQRLNGSSYDVYFSMSIDNGATWSTTYRYTLASSVSTSSPYPSVTMNFSANRKTVIYSSSSGLTAKTTTTTNPTSGSWANQLVGVSSDIYPTLASCGGSSYNISAYQKTSNNHVYYNYQNSSGSWGTETNLSSMVPGTALNTAPTICGMPSDGSVHLAWTRYTYLNGSTVSPRTFYMKNTSANGTWPYQYWQVSGWDQITPSITALASNKIDLLFQNSNNALYKQRFNGSSWAAPSLVALPSSRNPSISIGSSSAKYVYTNGSYSPFSVEMSTETLSKENESENVEKYYSRSVAFIESDESFVEYILHDIKLIKKDNSEAVVNLIPAELTDKSLTLVDAFSLQVSDYVDIDKDVIAIAVDYNINSSNSEKVVNDVEKPVSHFIKITDQDGKELINSTKIIDISQENEIFNKQSISVPVSGISGKVKISTLLNGFEVKKETIVSLGHLYNFSLQEIEKSEIELNKISEASPSEFTLEQNYPNPFNPTTSITYQLPQNGHVTLKIYNSLGQEVKELVNGYEEPGSYTVNFDAANLPSGIYFYKLQSGNITAVKKMLLLK